MLQCSDERNFLFTHATIQDRHSPSAAAVAPIWAPTYPNMPMMVRLCDDAAVAARDVAATFSDVKRSVQPPLDALVDACVSTLSRPSPSAPLTTIQAECWAVLLGPHPTDIVGVSPTGSGKTLAFLLPAFADLLQSRSPSAEMATADAPAAAEVSAAADATDAPAAAGATLRDAESAKARAEAAMRATATSAFAESLKAGLSKADAKAVARKQAQAAYKAALQAQAGSALRAASAGAASERTAQPHGAHPRSPPGGGVPVAAPLAAVTPLAAAPLAADAVVPRVLVLAPTRELCLQVLPRPLSPFFCPSAAISRPSPVHLPSLSYPHPWLCSQIGAVCESIVAALAGKLGAEHAAAVASGIVVGGIDFHRQVSLPRASTGLPWPSIAFYALPPTFLELPPTFP